MKRPFFYTGCLFAGFATATICLLAGCARQSAPTGGPKDVTPPQVDTLGSTPNFSTRFDKKRIEIRFDEWITLSDVQTQVVVSPPLITKRVPEIRLKGKTVIVDIPEAETLRPNTTYTINFGTAVKDLHEGNPAKDLRFVFSTGDYLDSLRVAGTVMDAFTGDPLENVSVMLYDNLSDSVVRLEKPYYFSKTDKTGQFIIENVRAGTFKAVAIEDIDQNLKWSGETERIGYPDSLASVYDSLRTVLAFRLFKDQSGLRLMDKSATRYGLVKLTYNTPADSVQPRADLPGLRLQTERNLDTLNVWYELERDTSWVLIAGEDTVAVRRLSREDFMKNHRFGFVGEVITSGSTKGKKASGTLPAATPPGTKAPVVTLNQNPVKPLSLIFNFPLSAVDTSKWQMTLDSSVFRGFSASPDTGKLRAAVVNIAWKPGKTYRLTLLPGAVTDYYGVVNLDTLQRNINVLSEKLLGGLNLTTQSLRPGARYVLQLLNNDKVEEERAFDAVSGEKRFVFINLPATTYTARLIEDRNGNGRWDSGSYFFKRQPEPVFSKKLEALRANWEIEATIVAGAQSLGKK